MNLPFNIDQFLNVFKTYNLAVCPAQIFLVILALFLIIIIFKKNKYSDKLISFGLAVFWLWMGIIYHYKYFTKINDAAYIFGSLFVIQGGLFFFFGVVKSNLIFIYKNNLTGIISIIFFIYALVFYPLLSYHFGHLYPYTPTFGLPCPTTIFTFGFILLLEKRKITVFIIPLLWSVIGFTAALKLGIYQDIGLIIAGIISVIVLFSKKF